jgi:hypothetical protein
LEKNMPRRAEGRKDGKTEGPNHTEGRTSLGGEIEQRKGREAEAPREIRAAEREKSRERVRGLGE